MKKILLFTFVAFLYINAHAQLFKIWGIDVGYLYVGPKAGFNMSTVSGDVGTGNDKMLNFGYQLGGVAKLGITDKLSIQPELAITSRGSKYKSSFATSTANFNYVGIPIVAKYAFSSFLGIDVYGSGGFYTDVLTSGHYVTTFPDSLNYPAEEYKIENWDTYNRVDFGFNFGLGGTKKLANNDIVSVDLRYAQGVVNIQSADNTNTKKSTSFQFTAYYLFDLTKWVNFRGEDKDAYQGTSKKKKQKTKKEENTNEIDGSKVEQR